MMQAWMTLRVARKWLEATDIWGFDFVDPDGSDLPPFAAGAHIDVEVVPGLVRQYSLCNTPARRDLYQIGVLRETASRGGSAAMVENIQIGQDVRVSAPRNHFELDPEARHSVLVAGGIGITPILCMAERLWVAGERFELHFAARSEDRAAFRKRILDAPWAGQASFHFDDGPVEQRLDLTAILGRAPEGSHLYVCGPGGLIEAALTLAKAADWSDGRVHREFFAPPVGTVEPADCSAFRIKLASSGDTLWVPADRSITAVLTDHGVEVPTSCEQGVCGTCITRILEGEPDHRDFFLTPEEQATNDQMMLCCSRSKSPLLVLDL